MKDGDLWRQFGNIANAKNPQAVALTKVKGHATWQMVEEETVRAVDRFGNNQSNEAADHGVVLEQPQLTKIAKFYASKHKRYKEFMKRIFAFIVFVKKADRRLRKESKKERDPFETGKVEEIKIEKL